MSGFFIQDKPARITKQLLLQHNSQEAYMAYYLGITPKTGRLFKSPLRSDETPTCAFYVNKQGELKFKDFRGDFNGNFIDVVMFKFKLSYAQALRMIAKDFGIIKSIGFTPKSIPIIDVPKIEPTKTADIKVEIRDFNDAELAWWGQYGISEKILKKFKVFCCNTVFLSGNLFASSSPNNPIYGYYRGRNTEDIELWRIYFPFRKTYRFLSNWSSKLIQGLKQLPKEGDTLVVTKSMKDVMTLYSLGITAIAPNSETLFLTESQFEKLKTRFKRIILFYDNDLAGIQNMRKIRKSFPGIECAWIPRSLNAKDISDFYKINGREKTLELIENYGEIKGRIIRIERREVA